MSIGRLIVVCLFAVGMLLAARSLWGEPPAAPKLSTVMPAADLAAQIRQYEADIDAALGSEADYKVQADKIRKAASMTAVLALVLAHHDTATDLSPAAPAILKAAQNLAKAKDYAAAKASANELKAAIARMGVSEPAPPWAKIVGQGTVMKEASDINTRLRNSLRRFDPRRLEQNAQAASTLAALAQATIYDTHEVHDAAELPKWYQFCEEMRSAAGDLSQKIKARDKAGATAAADRLTKSCEACHDVFSPM